MLTSLSALKHLLILCKPVQTGVLNGQINYKANNSHPLIWPNNSHRSLQCDSYECRVQLFSELLQLCSWIFLSDNKRFVSNESKIEREDQEENLQHILHNIDDSILCESSSLSEFLQWKKYTNQINLFYEQKYLKNTNCKYRFLKLQQIVLTMITDVPSDVDLFGLSYDCLKIIGQLLKFVDRGVVVHFIYYI